MPPKTSPLYQDIFWVVKLICLLERVNEAVIELAGVGTGIWVGDGTAVGSGILVGVDVGMGVDVGGGTGVLVGVQFGVAEGCVGTIVQVALGIGFPDFGSGVFVGVNVDWGNVKKMVAVCVLVGTTGLF